MGMYAVFVDEAGYSKKWQDESEIENQPYHVRVAVAIPMDNLPYAYTDLRERICNAIRDVRVPFEFECEKLGLGEEIKAKEIDKGASPWRDSPFLRDEIREAYLRIPNDFEGVAFAVVIDKRRHLARYGKMAENPLHLSYQYMFERLQMFLQDQKVFVDGGTRDEHMEGVELMQDGSSVVYRDERYGRYVEQWISLDRIIELHTVNSKYSLGIQIADFFARIVYSWRKHGKNSNYPGWSIVHETLYKKKGKLEGVGYKEFP